MAVHYPDLWPCNHKGPLPEDPNKYRWRVHAQTFSVAIDPDAEIFGSQPTLALLAYEVVKVTPKGAWVKTSTFGEGTSFVLNGSGKRLAHDTKAHAYESLIARKQRAIRIMRSRIAEAEEFIRLAEVQFGK